MRIPERTVDSMVAIEIARLDPSAIISSPTNTAGAVDHRVRHSFAITVLECKGVDDRSRIPIRLSQLWDYAYGIGPREVVYALPSVPSHRPWLRRCSEPCCGGVGCRFCPRDARSWTGLESWVRRLPSDDQIQPWFAHWCWCVPSGSLARKIGISSTTRATGTHSLEWSDDQLGALPDAVRLCHWFGSPPASATWSRAVSEGLESSPDLAVLAETDATEQFGETPPLVVLLPSPVGDDA